MDFEKDVDDTRISDVELKKVSTLALLKVEQEDEVTRIEADLKAAKERLRKTTEVDLPEAMREVGLTEFKTNDGYEVSVKEEVFASISEKNRQAAHAWLQEHGLSEIIKVEYKIPLGGSEDDRQRAAELVSIFGQTGVDFSSKEAVHPSTLKAMVKEQLSKGVDMPDKIFGIHRASIAKVVRP